MATSDDSSHRPVASSRHWDVAPLYVSCLTVGFHRVVHDGHPLDMLQLHGWMTRRTRFMIVREAVPGFIPDYSNRARRQTVRGRSGLCPPQPLSGIWRP
jgi:hypothetical protein